MVQKLVLNEKMSKEAFDSALRNHFKFSLLNFAAIIADVLAGQSVLNKKVPRMRLVDIKKKWRELENLKKRAEKILDDPLFNVFPDFDKKIRKVIHDIDKILNDWQGLIDVLNKYLPMPHLEKKPRPIRNSYQIGLLWSHAMKGIDNQISWKDICTLFDWFFNKLEDTDYFANYELSDIDSLKTLRNRQWKNNKEKILYSTVNLLYFPFWGKQAHRPNILAKLTNGAVLACPIQSIKFYGNKIITKFEYEGKFWARETYWRDGSCESIIKDYRQDDDKSEKDKLLLEVP